MMLKNEFGFINTQNSPLIKQNTPTQKHSNFSFNLPPQKFPAQQFPSKPIFTQQKQGIQPQGYNRFARQNVINGIETRRNFKVQPMSGITIQTIPMPAQTNFNNEIQDENLDEENLENDNSEDESFLDDETQDIQDT